MYIYKCDGFDYSDCGVKHSMAELPFILKIYIVKNTRGFLFFVLIFIILNIPCGKSQENVRQWERFELVLKHNPTGNYNVCQFSDSFKPSLR